MSVLSSATWLSGCWTFTKQQEDSLSSREMDGFRRNPAGSFADFCKDLHRLGHELAKVYLAEPVAMNHRTEHRLERHFCAIL